MTKTHKKPVHSSKAKTETPAVIYMNFSHPGWVGCSLQGSCYPADIGTRHRSAASQWIQRELQLATWDHTQTHTWDTVRGLSLTSWALDETPRGLVKIKM